MGYYHNDTGKEALIREVKKLADRLNKYLDFDPVWMLNYEDLLDLKHELIEEIMLTDDTMSKGVLNVQKLLRKTEI